MSFKRAKKNELPLADKLMITTVLPRTDEERFYNQFSRSLSRFGFQQILLPPVMSRESFVKIPDSERIFGKDLIELERKAVPASTILAPTQLFNLISKYAEAASAHERLGLKSHYPVQKWFYMSPIVSSGADGLSISQELGVFIAGDNSSLAHVQLINTLTEAFRGLLDAELSVAVNGLGCKNCHKDFREMLIDHLDRSSYNLCATCRTQFKNNPLVVWSCETATCRELGMSGPQVLDFLDEECKHDLTGILESLDSLSLGYILNPTLVSVLNKTKVVFQLSLGPKTETMLGSGGDFSSWTSGFPQGEFPLIGFLSPLENLMRHAVTDQKKLNESVEVFLIALGSAAACKTMLLERALRASGIRVAESLLQTSGIKDQLNEASERSADIALIIGQKEALDEMVIMRDIRSGMQEVFGTDRIIVEVLKRLGK